MKAMSLLVLHILTEKNQAESHLVVKINLSRRISQRKVGHITVIFLARELYKIKKTLKLLQLLVFRQRQKWEMRMDLMNQGFEVIDDKAPELSKTDGLYDCT